MPSVIHFCASSTPAESGLPGARMVLYRSYTVAANIVGIERKNENSSAASRDIRATCPAAIVDIDRDVPGNTADRIWQAPIQIACGNDMSSITQVLMRVNVACGPRIS